MLIIALTIKYEAILKYTAKCTRNTLKKNQRNISKTNEKNTSKKITVKYICINAATILMLPFYNSSIPYPVHI